MMSEEALECFAKYQSNAAFAGNLEKVMPENLDWSCVLRFYAAVHLINAFLIDKRNVHFDPASAVHEALHRPMVGKT